MGSCLCCQIPTPGRCFSNVNLDLVSPLPSSQGFTNLLTMNHRTVRWRKAVTNQHDSRDLRQDFHLNPDVESQISRPQTEVPSSRPLCGQRFVPATGSDYQFPPSEQQYDQEVPPFLDVCTHLASADWVQHLPLVMSGLWSALRDDFRFSHVEAVLGSTLFQPWVLSSSNYQFPPTEKWYD